MGKIQKFGGDQVHSGHYIKGDGNKEIVRKSLDNIYFNDYQFWNDENVELPLPYECASIFLRGSCNIFAYELYKKYGYDVYEIKSRDGKANHWFCQSKY